MDTGTAASTRSDTTELARQIRITASRLEKLAASAADAVDVPQPRPIQGESAKPPNEPNNINTILRSALRTLRRVEEALNETHNRLGNPFSEKQAIQEAESAG